MKNIFIFAVLLSGMCAYAMPENFSAAGGKVAILATTKPGFIKIEGNGNPASGQLTVDSGKVSGNFEFDLTSLKTGIEKRDDHMKNKYLEVDKYPKATLAIQSAKPIEKFSSKTPKLDDASFDGSLTLHGQTKPVSGKFNVGADGAVTANFTVKLTDFGITIPSFAGITVNNEIAITVNIEKLKTTNVAAAN